MKRYKDLEIYQISYELAIKIHKFSLKLPDMNCTKKAAKLENHQKGLLHV
jgi:hypothetical protein